MSFNFDNFMTAMAKLLPVVGETVIALHPDNPNEAMKIRVGAGLVKAIVDSLHQSSDSAQASDPNSGVQ